MEHERSTRARARIEAALARIESGAQRSANRAGEAELEGLRQRHDKLRSAVQDSLEQLDQLIEGQLTGGQPAEGIRA